MEPKPARKPGRTLDPTYEKLVEQFLSGDADSQEIDWSAMGRRWATVAQGLRVAIKRLGLTDDVFVSVSEVEQLINLRRRPKQ